MENSETNFPQQEMTRPRCPDDAIADMLYFMGLEDRLKRVAPGVYKADDDDKYIPGLVKLTNE